MKAGAIGCGALALVLVLAVSFCSGDGSDKVTAGTGDPKTDSIALYQAVMSEVKECDRASEKMGNYLQGSDEVAAYRVAEDAALTCLGVRGKIDEIGVPDSLSEADQKLAKESLEECSNAYLNKWSWVDGIKTAIDEGSSPAKLADIQRSGEAMQSGTLSCVAGLFSLASSNGATDKDLGIDTDAAQPGN